MYFALSVATGLKRVCGKGSGGRGEGGGGVLIRRVKGCVKKYWNSFFYENILILDTKSGWLRKK